MTEKYSIPMRLIHWFMALSIISLFGAGLYMTGLADKDPNKFQFFYPMHKSFGVLVLILLTLRIIFRHTAARPKMPTVLASWERTLAKLTHIGLYFGMLLVPVSGWLMSNSGGHPVKLFGIAMPTLVEENESLSGIFHEIHEIAPFVLIALVVIHAAGAWKHRLIDKDPEADVLKRML